MSNVARLMHTVVLKRIGLARRRPHACEQPDHVMLSNSEQPHPTPPPRKKAKLTHRDEMEMDNPLDAVWLCGGMLSANG